MIGDFLNRVFLEKPGGWEVTIIPSHEGEICRFIVKKAKKTVLVYGRLGSFGEPYWEISQSKSDVFRCGLNETEELFSKIKEELDSEI